MDTGIIVILICGVLFYYLFTIMFYFIHSKNKEFFQMVVFPLPVAFIMILIYFLFFDVNNVDEYRTMVIILIAISVMAGMFILYHCIIGKQKKDLLFYGKVITSIILILTPLLLYSPSLAPVMIFVYLICGISLGVNGYLKYQSDKRIGLLYVYTSLVFIVIIPAIAFTVTKFYQDNLEPEIIYRRARDDIVTCHLPATPIIPGPEGFHLSVLYSGLFVFLFSVLSSARKAKLQKQLKKNGVIPYEFYKIINNRGKK
jgi:hypothetical protein